MHERTLRAALLAGLLLLLAAPAAQAWEVHVSITGAGQVTETTPANLVGSDCVTSTTNPTGQVGKHCYPGDPNGEYNSGWTVRYQATPRSGYRFVRWQSDGSSNPVICDDAGGSPTYTGSACQFWTFDNLQTRAVFVDDTAPVMASLSGPNQVVNGPATFTFSASADPTFKHFECRVGGVHEWQTCSSGHNENPGTGTYTFQVRAVDWSGNRSPVSQRDWTVDKVAPETSVTAGTSGTVSSSDASFDFTSNEQATFICALDGVQTACGSPKRYSGLGEGPHTFTVAARDVAGNEDATPATGSWTVDTVAPQTTITGGPAATTTSTVASFAFGAGGAAEFECSLDGAAFAPCSSPKALAGLSVGSHTFRVWARDGAGNVDGSPAARTWTVAAPAPASPAPSAGTGTTVGTPAPASTLTPAGTPALPAFAPSFKAKARVRRALTTFLRLKLAGVPADARVQLKCKGKGCRFRSRTVSHRGGTLNLRTAAKRKLRAGTTLEIRVTSADGRLRVARWQARRGKAPKQSIRCAAPGGRLGRCATAR